MQDERDQQCSEDRRPCCYVEQSDYRIAPRRHAAGIGGSGLLTFLVRYEALLLIGGSALMIYGLIRIYHSILREIAVATVVFSSLIPGVLRAIWDYDRDIVMGNRFAYYHMIRIYPRYSAPSNSSSLAPICKR
ncbi:MAG: hypothetical protein ACE5JP_09125 [Candidatus Bipolaricaulia bacterium]